MVPSVDDPEIGKIKQNVKKTDRLSQTAVDVVYSPSDTIEMELFTPHGECRPVEDVLVPLRQPESESFVDSAHCPYPLEPQMVIQPPISDESPADPKPKVPAKDIPTTTADNVQPITSAQPESQSPEPETERGKE